MNKIELAVQDKGTAQVASRILVSPNRLRNWMKRGIPVEYCARLELALDKKVTRKDMRPDDWRDIWPELATPKPKAKR